MAKFEICVHKWVDLSERTHGVTLMNDSKYGYKVLNSTLDLNLLRSTGSPGVDADKGRHAFTYAIYPHAGDEYGVDIARRAYELNIPLAVYKSGEFAGSLAKQYSFAGTDAENVFIETVKQAEDDDSIVMRLYEACGYGCETELYLPPSGQTAELTDIMEENPSTLQIGGNRARLSFRPYEIHTVKIIGN